MTRTILIHKTVLSTVHGLVHITYCTGELDPSNNAREPLFKERLIEFSLT